MVLDAGGNRCKQPLPQPVQILHKFPPFRHPPPFGVKACLKVTSFAAEPLDEPSQ